MVTIDKAIAKYLEYVQASQSAGTARTYATGLRHFGRYLASLSLLPKATEAGSITLSIITDYIAWLYNYLLKKAGGRPEHVRESTRSTYLAALSGFLEYLVFQMRLLRMSTEDYDIVRQTLSKAVKRHGRDELPPEKLPAPEIVKALLTEVRKPLALSEDATPGDKRRRELIHLRNIALIEALLSSGMRVGELVQLERGHLLHNVKGAVVKYTKSKKEREVLFSDRAWTAIETYLEARQDEARTRNVARLAVFARHDDRVGARVLPMTTRSVENIFVDLSARAGILQRFHLTPHTLRHYFATEFLSETGDLALTQYALGHASPATTRIYAKTKRDDYRRAHKSVFRGE